MAEQSPQPEERPTLDYRGDAPRAEGAGDVREQARRAEEWLSSPAPSRFTRLMWRVLVLVALAIVIWTCVSVVQSFLRRS